MAETQNQSEKKNDQETRYKVIKSDFGPFPNGSVFSEKQFAALHPLKDAKDADRSAYLDGLLERGIKLGVIVPTTDETTPVEAGPFNPKAPSIMDGVRASIRETETNKANADAVKQADLAAREGEKK